jgi:MFS family permease
MLLPTLPIYLADVGFGQQKIGLIIGAMALSLLVVRPSLGQLADQRGRNGVLLLGCLVAATAPLGYLALKHFWPLVALRLYHGLSIAAFTTAYVALAADLAPPHQRGEIMGHMGLANPIGIALGPALAGYLLGTVDSFTIIFLGSALLGLGSMWLTMILPDRPWPQPTTDRASMVAAMGQILQTPALAIPSAMLVLVGFPFGAIHTFIPLYIQNAGATLNPGLFYLAAAVMSFMARLIFGRLTDRHGRGLFIFLSLLGYACSMGMLAVAQGTAWFLGAAMVEGMSLGTLMPTTIALLTDRCHPEQRGLVFAIGIAGLDGGIAIAAPLFGWVAAAWGYPSIFALSMGFVLLATTLFVLLGNKTIGSSWRFALGVEADRYRSGVQPHD